MSRPGLHSLDLGLLVFLSLFSSTSATIASNWTNPNARLPSFSSTYLVGERITLAWQPLNQSTNDLWLTRYDISNNYTLRIAYDLDISQAGSFQWTIAVPQEEVEHDTRFAFAFVPAGSIYDAATDSNLDSPAFNLMMVNQATPPNGTVSPSSAGSTSPTALPSASTSTTEPSATLVPSSDESSGLSSPKIIGIVVGVLAVLGFISLAGLLVFKKKKSRHTQNLSVDSDVTVTGPYEVLGSNRSPSELNSKEIQVHEMTCSQDTLAHESGGTPVHEIANTVKRPGLHEMPG